MENKLNELASGIICLGIAVLASYVAVHLIEML